MKFKFRYVQDFSRLYSIFFCTAQTYFLLFPMFMLAFSSNKYRSILDINHYGEANIEMILWAITFPIVIYGMYLNLRPVLEGIVKNGFN